MILLYLDMKSMSLNVSTNKKMLHQNPLFKFAAVFTILLFVIYILSDFTDYTDYSEEPEAYKRYHTSIYSIDKRSQLEKSQKIKWMANSVITKNYKRIGFGEHGARGVLKDAEEIKKNDELFKTFGMSVVVSDKISVNRSVPDFRVKGCFNKKYLKSLPPVSIIIIFHNEIFSCFKRTLHSLYNRTPHKLIKEIVLVNDASTLDYLYKPLKDYIKENFMKLNIRIINLKKRSGLVVAKMAGARNATGDYLFFMEPHVEMGYNWLPPLLEPVVHDHKTATVPIIDFIPFHVLNIRANKPSRGVFDWDLNYQQLPLLPETNPETSDSYPTPVMTGGIFLIRKDYFFELEGYDEELVIWGAENLELSFKLNLCGGKLIEVPCSRIGHVFRNFNKFRKLGNLDFAAFNNKRIAEVWMREYKDYIYKRNPRRYDKIHPGDLTKPIAVRERLKCKPFKYFLEVIAPDLIQKYPYDPVQFSHGIVRLVNTNYCIDTLSQGLGKTLGLFQCDDNVTEPRATQNFEFTQFKDVRLRNGEICWDSTKVSLQKCDLELNQQKFHYDHVKKKIKHGELCLEAILKINSLKMAKCNKDSMFTLQSWEWGFANKTALDNFADFQ